MSDVNLPEDWILVRLGDVIQLKTGKLDANAANDGGKYPFFTCAESVSRINLWEFDTSAVLLAGNGSFSVKKYSGKFNAYQRTYVIEPLGISLSFLYLLIKENIRKITSGERGTAIPYIRKGDIADITLSLPPLAEQKVIADKLDTLLAQVETTKARLERIPNILKTFRQSVLAAAVSGKLTEEWRGQKMSVDDVCITGFDGPFGSKLKSSDYTESGVRVARLENVSHLVFDNYKATYISTDKYSTLKKNTLKVGDVLFSSFVDEEVKVCVFKITGEIFINKADCFCLRPNHKLVSSEYLSYILASSTSYKQIKDQVQGVTRPRINLRILKGLIFEFPPVEEQTQIVRRVEELFAFADIIEQKANAALERVNNLTQSILAKAFRGELTADWRAANPELITGDNSADALLAKINAEREAMKKQPRKKAAARKVQ